MALPLRTKRIHHEAAEACEPSRRDLPRLRGRVVRLALKRSGEPG